MALKNCPECDLMVSDKASVCPHCGYPLKNISLKKATSPRRMRLPNGFGSITELRRTNIRNRFWVRVPTGKTPTGHIIQSPLKPKAYFPTYNQAYEALVEYNRNPYDLDSDITMNELFQKWSEMKQSEYNNPSSFRAIDAAWKYCSEIYNLRVRAVSARHLKGCIENGTVVETRGKKRGLVKTASPNMKQTIKSMFNQLFDYAVEYEICTSNPARTFELSKKINDEIKESIKPHLIFTEDELTLLWDHLGKYPYIDWILIQCYMGWRPQEMGLIKIDEINIDESYIQSGMKTDAGKMRIVPIHSKIYDLVNRNITIAKSMGSEYLLNEKGSTHSGSTRITYDKYSYRFNKVMTWLNMNPNHRPHDPRKTFITRCKKANVDEYALKEMVGHSIQDITESVYTVRDVEWLRSDLEKMQ